MWRRDQLLTLPAWEFGVCAPATWLIAPMLFSSGLVHGFLLAETFFITRPQSSILRHTLERLRNRCRSFFLCLQLDSQGLTRQPTSAAQPGNLDPRAGQVAQNPFTANLDPGMQRVGGLPKRAGAHGDHDRMVDSIASKH